MEDIIKFYEDRIKHLEEMLEKSMEMNRTLMEKLGDRPTTIPSYPYSFPAEEVKPKCPKCGLVLEKVMGYCCPNNPCPTGLGGVWCSTNG